MNTNPLLLGNDVVDLSEPGVDNKIHDIRFMNRIFTKEENARINSTGASSRYLWMCWAAKESAFKIVKKINPNAVFSHRKFVVNDWQIAPIELRPYDMVGSVSYEHLQFAVGWHVNSAYIHCVASSSNHYQFSSQIGIEIEKLNEIDSNENIEQVTAQLTGQLTDYLTDRENESVHSRASREVRLLAKSLFMKMNSTKNKLVSSPEIIRDRADSGEFGPPVLYDNGKILSEADISLSHDGKFVAAAICLNC